MSLMPQQVAYQPLPRRQRCHVLHVQQSKASSRRLDLDHVVRHSSFRRPVFSLDGIAQSQTAVGEPPEYSGKTLILDTRFNPPVVRPLHIEESSRLMEAPDGELGLYMKLNPNADLEELSRFVGDGMAARFVEAVGTRTAKRIKQYKFALAMRLANCSATRVQALARGVRSRSKRTGQVDSDTNEAFDTNTRGLGSSGARVARSSKLYANCHYHRARSALADLSITSVREVIELTVESAAVTIQAVARGWRVRRLAPKIRVAKAELDEALLEYERDEFARIRDAHVPTRRAHMLAIYGMPMANCHGFDGCSRGSGGPSKVLRGVIGNPHSAESMALSQFALLTASVHANTNKTYHSAVKPWFAWRMLGALDPYVCDRASHKVKQQELMDFYCYHAETVKWPPGWLHVQLCAVRLYHMLKGNELDLRTMARLSAAKKGFKRNYGGPQRKVAATVELLHEARGVRERRA